MNFKAIFRVLTYAIFLLIAFPLFVSAQQDKGLKGDVIKVKSTPDFIITGNGSSENWSRCNWNNIIQRDSKVLRNNGWNISPDQDRIEGIQYKTQFKILYSGKGIYCLYKCEDSVITSTLKGDFLNLFNEDVVEAFFWPDTKMPVYFEYELSPLNYQLPLLIVNKMGMINGWQPWRDEGPRKITHAIDIDKDASGKPVSWTAEFFIPFELLAALGNTPPNKGTMWRANFYRIDYDKKPEYSSWQLTRKGYHDFEKFGTIEFD